MAHNLWSTIKMTQLNTARSQFSYMSIQTLLLSTSYSTKAGLNILRWQCVLISCVWGRENEFVLILCACEREKKERERVCAVHTYSIWSNGAAHTTIFKRKWEDIEQWDWEPHHRLERKCLITLLNVEATDPVLLPFYPRDADKWIRP